MKLILHLILEKKAALRIVAITACLILTLLPTGCSSTPTLKSYSHQQAIDNGDVVDVHGQITNIEKLEDFVNSVDHGSAAKLRITTYTIEGDPIIQGLD